MNDSRIMNHESVTVDSFGEDNENAGVRILETGTDSFVQILDSEIIFCLWCLLQDPFDS